jgi:hypothetical protein
MRPLKEMAKSLASWATLAAAPALTSSVEGNTERPSDRSALMSMPSASRDGRW